MQARSSSEESSFQEIDAYVQSEMKAASIPGLAYGIVKGDQIVHLQAFGVADSTGRPVTLQTPFLIGSVGKIITSLAIQQLVNAGQVDLDAPVQTYIPWFHLADTEASKSITIRHLLTHTSGLSNGSGVNPRFYQTDHFTNEEFVQILEQTRLDRPVGSSREYSNLNFIILGQVIEQVTGTSYEDYVQKNIFSPLDMKHSYMDITKARQAGLAQGHRILFGFLAPVQLPYPRGAMAAGYQISTVEDMSHLLIAHLNAGQYRERSVLSLDGKPAENTNNGTNDYDIHWIKLDSILQGYTDGQSGSTLDYSACYYILPYFDTGVVVLTNANTAEATSTKSAQTIAFDILEMTAGFSLRSEALSIKTIYVGIDLILLGGLAIVATQFLRLGNWKRRLFNRQGKTWFSFLPAFLICFVLPLIILVGIPILEPAPFVPGMPFTGAWSFFLYILPDIGYSLLAISVLLLVVGLIKLFWFLRYVKQSPNTNHIIERETWNG